MTVMNFKCILYLMKKSFDIALESENTKFRDFYMKANHALEAFSKMNMWSPWPNFPILFITFVQ